MMPPPPPPPPPPSISGAWVEHLPSKSCFGAASAGRAPFTCRRLPTPSTALPPSAPRRRRDGGGATGEGEGRSAARDRGARGGGGGGTASAPDMRMGGEIPVDPAKEAAMLAGILWDWPAAGCERRRRRRRWARAWRWVEARVRAAYRRFASRQGQPGTTTASARGQPRLACSGVELGVSGGGCGRARVVGGSGILRTSARDRQRRGDFQRAAATARWRGLPIGGRAHVGAHLSSPRHAQVGGRDIGCVERRRSRVTQRCLPRWTADHVAAPGL